MLLALYCIDGSERYALRIATKLKQTVEHTRSTLNQLRERHLVQPVPRRRNHKVYYLQPEKGLLYYAIQRHLELRTLGVAANKKNFDGFIQRFKTENEL